MFCFLSRIASSCLLDRPNVGVTALANAIPGMGALLLLNLASNDLRAEGTKLLAAALKGNQIMTELNISSNRMTCGRDISGVVALADVIPDMGAMTLLNARDNYIEGEGKRALQQAAGSRCGT